MEAIIERWISNGVFQRLLIISLSLILILVVVYYINKTISRNVTDINHKYRVRKTTSSIGYIIILAIILFVFSDKLGNVGIALGLAGAGIAFAPQEVITALLAGLVLF